MNSFLTNLIATAVISVNTVAIPTPAPVKEPISEVSYSLENRHKSEFVNDVFRDNILLAVEYIGGMAKSQTVDWEKVGKSGPSGFILKPGETFAFHDAVFDKYENKVAATTNAHFIASEGFKTDGWLVGDGVCHLASFMKVAAEKAGLEVEAPVRHDFAVIPDVIREDGVSIFSQNEVQNLYITNNKTTDIEFVFNYSDGSLSIGVFQSK